MLKESQKIEMIIGYVLLGRLESRFIEVEGRKKVSPSVTVYGVGRDSRNKWNIDCARTMRRSLRKAC